MPFSAASAARPSSSSSPSLSERARAHFRTLIASFGVVVVVVVAVLVRPPSAAPRIDDRLSPPR